MKISISRLEWAHTTEVSFGVDCMTIRIYFFRRHEYKQNLVMIRSRFPQTFKINTSKLGIRGCHLCVWSLVQYPQMPSLCWMSSLMTLAQVIMGQILCHNYVFPCVWLRVFPFTGPFEGNPPVTSGFPSHRANKTDLWCSFDASQN